jgi:haloalkane dehalogenase
VTHGSPLPAKKFCQVNGRRLAYVEQGGGDPVVLLHGNPTSSFLWRDVIPALLGCGRIIVPDLIGQGDSDKLPATDGPDRYSFEAAYAYLDGLLAALDANQKVTLVLHDWGTALGFHWARLHPQQVRGIAYMRAWSCPCQAGTTGRKKRGAFFRAFAPPRART